MQDVTVNVGISASDEFLKEMLLFYENCVENDKFKSISKKENYTAQWSFTFIGGKEFFR